MQSVCKFKITPEGHDQYHSKSTELEGKNGTV